MVSVYAKNFGCGVCSKKDEDASFAKSQLLDADRWWCAYRIPLSRHDQLNIYFWMRNEQNEHVHLFIEREMTTTSCQTVVDVSLVETMKNSIDAWRLVYYISTWIGKIHKFQYQRIFLVRRKEKLASDLLEWNFRFQLSRAYISKYVYSSPLGWHGIYQVLKTVVDSFCECHLWQLLTHHPMGDIMAVGWDGNLPSYHFYYAVIQTSVWMCVGATHFNGFIMDPIPDRWDSDFRKYYQTRYNASPKTHRTRTDMALFFVSYLRPKKRK